MTGSTATDPDRDSDDAGAGLEQQQDAASVERPTDSPAGEQAHAAGTGGESSHETVPGAPPAPEDQSFGWRGWALVGALVFAFLLIPWTIVYLPQAEGFLSSLGLGLRDAYLVLPLLPALGLGAVAVWSAVASHRDRTNQR